MSSPSRPERRRFRRRTVRLLVDYQGPDGMGCEYGTTLGAGGLFLETDAPLPHGTPIKLRFRLPHCEQLHEIEGRVVWVHEPRADNPRIDRAPGMGITFDDPPAVARLARELDEVP